MARQRLTPVEVGGDSFASYFTNPGREFIPSGCTLLDQVLGGGWAEGRIVNIVGDKSAGKTLLATEAAANFAIKYPSPKDLIRYRESEAAFDIPYAKCLGMPVDRVDFGSVHTVEEFFSDLDQAVKTKRPNLYVLDSLDALSDIEETERPIDKGTYGTGKARRMSELFRRLAAKVEASRMTLIIISQIRARIGFGFGRTTTRAGGKAMDFYASQVVYLSHMGALHRSIGKVKRPVGLKIHAKCDKNKVGLPLRECEFNLRFAYGIDDLTSCINWLREVGYLKDIGVSDKAVPEFLKATNALPNDRYIDTLVNVQLKVKERWREIERTFLPNRSKYNGPRVQT